MSLGIYLNLITSSINLLIMYKYFTNNKLLYISSICASISYIFVLNPVSFYFSDSFRMAFTGFLGSISLIITSFLILKTKDKLWRFYALSNYGKIYLYIFSLFVIWMLINGIIDLRENSNFFYSAFGLVLCFVSIVLSLNALKKIQVLIQTIYLFSLLILILQLIYFFIDGNTKLYIFVFLNCLAFSIIFNTNHIKKFIVLLLTYFLFIYLIKDNNFIGKFLIHNPSFGFRFNEENQIYLQVSAFISYLVIYYFSNIVSNNSKNKILNSFMFFLSFAVLLDSQGRASVLSILVIVIINIFKLKDFKSIIKITLSILSFILIEAILFSPVSIDRYSNIRKDQISPKITLSKNQSNPIITSRNDQITRLYSDKINTFEDFIDTYPVKLTPENINLLKPLVDVNKLYEDFIQFGSLEYPTKLGRFILQDSSYRGILFVSSIMIPLKSYQHFIYGIGLGNFPLALGYTDPPESKFPPHNLVLESFVEGGLVGAILYISLLLLVFLRYLKVKHSNFEMNFLGTLSIFLISNQMFLGGLVTLFMGMFFISSFVFCRNLQT